MSSPVLALFLFLLFFKISPASRMVHRQTVIAGQLPMRKTTDNDVDNNLLDNTINTMSKNPVFHSTSSEKPKLLTISFKDDPQGSLGAQLINCDKVSYRMVPMS